MSNIKLDKNYNIKEEKLPYANGLIDSVDLIISAHADNIITQDEALLLLKIVIKKEMTKEIKTSLPLQKQIPEIHSLFMNLKTKQVKHA